MSTIRNPVGPQPSSVYWRRRLVLLGLLAAVVIIVLLIIWPRGGGDTPPATDDATSSNTAAPEDEIDPDAEAGACAPGSVTVAAITDEDVYAAGEQPLLSLSLTNTGTAPCFFNAGSDVQEYRITSGEDPIWNSKDCQTEPVAAEVELEPGVALTTTPFAWDRTRSDPATCAGERPQVTAGGATYRLAVTVDGVESSTDEPFILN